MPMVLNGIEVAQNGDMRMSDIEIGSFWHEKQECSTIGIVYVYEVSSERIDYYMNNERCGCSPDVFLNTFERFESIGPELKALIEVVSRFRDWGEAVSEKSESEDEDDLLNFSQEIIDAVNKYEAAHD